MIQHTAELFQVTLMHQLSDHILLFFFLCESALSHFESESVKKKQRGYEMC